MEIPSELLDLKLAYSRVKRDVNSDFICCPIEIELFNSSREANLQKLGSAIEKDYQPTEPRRINVPKPNRTLRPGAVPVLRDRIVMQALIDNIAESVDDQLIPPGDEVVFSNRVKKNGDEQMFEFGGYDSFEEKTLDAVRCGKKYLLDTDIAAYFEHIDMGILAARLSSFSVDDRIATSILEIIDIWNGTSYHGLPQGIYPSDFLGNIYLDNVDKYMLRNGYNYCRFGDDIRVFGDSKLELYRALQDLTIQLRRLHLNLQTEKQQLLYGNRLKEKVDKNSEFQEFLNTLPPKVVVTYDYGGDLEIAEMEITASDVEASEELLLGYLRQHVFGSEDIYNPRMLRRCIRILTKLDSNLAEDDVLSWLPYYPAETKIFVEYLETCESFSKIKDSLIEYLASENNIYEWSEMWILEYLIRAKMKFQDGTNLNKPNIATIRRIAYDRNKHWACRFKAIQILGLYFDEQERSELMRLYDNESQLEIQHAIILGCGDLNKIERNKFYRLCEEKSKDVKDLIRLIKNR